MASKSAKELMEKYDLEGDGNISDEDIERRIRITELERKEEKAEAHKQIAVSCVFMIIGYIVLITLPIVPDARAEIIASMSDMFFITMGTIIGTFMGVTAYMSRN